jgi:hypothetical protein
MHKLGHTPYIEKKIAELVVASFTTNTMIGANYVCIEYQMIQYFMNMPYKAFMLF